jgi:hypothetical protein
MSWEKLASYLEELLLLYQDELASRGIWKGQKMSDNRRVVLKEKLVSYKNS